MRVSFYSAALIAVGLILMTECDAVSLTQQQE